MDDTPATKQKNDICILYLHVYVDLEDEHHFVFMCNMFNMSRYICV